MSNIFTRYMKSHWKVDDMGRGKSRVSRQRHRKMIKRKAQRQYDLDHRDN